MSFLAGLAKQSNASDEVVATVRRANTARHVLEIIQENKVEGFFDLICSNVHKHMREHSNNDVLIDVMLFDFDGNILARKTTQ